MFQWSIAALEPNTLHSYHPPVFFIHSQADGWHQITSKTSTKVQLNVPDLLLEQLAGCEAKPYFFFFIFFFIVCGFQATAP